jgi:tellurite resistance protein TerC
MLSVDNLFVFRSIFCLFKTPDDQKHKPLFWGIVGAVIFRMAFFVVEELLLHSFHWMHFVLGAFLIYTGVKIIFVNDDDEINAEQHPLLLAVTRYVPFVDSYSPNIRFIARVPELKSTGEVYLPDWVPPKLPSRPPSPCVSLNPSPEASPAPSPALSPRDNAQRQTLGPDSITAPLPEDLVYRFRFTRLFVVVLCLEVTDIIFAVDSVSAIVAQIPDLFLAYTACVFAMLGLRATFFVVDGLVKLFFLLNYAVSGILIFLGFKLLVRAYIHIPPEIVCLVLVSTLSASIIGSVVINKLKGVPICGDERASVSSSKEGSLCQAEKGEAAQH